MIKRILVPAATLGALAAIAVLTASPSFALSAKECSVKYNAAKSAGTLNGLNWNEFRKQECGTRRCSGRRQAGHKAVNGNSRGDHEGPFGRRFPESRRFEVLQGIRGQGAHAHVPRSVPRQ